MEGNFLKIIFVIDESGSMHGSESDVIGGFNSYIERHRKENTGRVSVSLYKFNSIVTKVFVNQPIAKISNLTLKDYSPDSFTALYDAVGKAIHEADNELSTNPKNERPDKVLMIIITDGQENSSKEFSSHAIKTLISTHENLLNWDFIFLGAELENYTDANLMGLKNKVPLKKSDLRNRIDRVADTDFKFFMSKDSEYDTSGLVENLSNETSIKPKTIFEKLKQRLFD